MAMTQSPGAICDESPNFTSGSGRRRLLDELDQRAVGELIAADQLRVVELVVVAVERHLNLRRVLDDVVVGQDEAVLADDEAGARGALRSAAAGGSGRAALVAGSGTSIARRVGGAEEAAEQIVVAAPPPKKSDEVLPRPSSRS